MKKLIAKRLHPWVSNVHTWLLGNLWFSFFASRFVGPWNRTGDLSVSGWSFVRPQQLSWGFLYKYDMCVYIYSRYIYDVRIYPPAILNFVDYCQLDVASFWLLNSRPSCCNSEASEPRRLLFSWAHDNKAHPQHRHNKWWNFKLAICRNSHKNLMRTQSILTHFFVSCLIFRIFLEGDLLPFLFAFNFDLSLALW